MMPKAPEAIPDELIADYTISGAIPLVPNYWDNASDESQKELNEKFNETEFSNSLERTKNKEVNYYGDTDTWLYTALDKYPIKDKSVCIVGSTYPWYEAIAVNYGASDVVVIEYAERESFHERVSYIKPDEVGDRKFDVCISISSFEHDGLGRYGDPLNPVGDFDAMKSAKNYVKKGGYMFLAVPVGRDVLFFNAHRVYGGVRLPKLLENWEVLASIGFAEEHLTMYNPGPHQPLFILRNN